MCITNGTIPFSILARYGFIGKTFMNSLVSTGEISSDTKLNYFSSIETIATKMYDDMNLVLRKKMNLENFIELYGHLRPNSYDIESPTYLENYDNFLPKNSFNNKNLKDAKFKFSKDEFILIENTLKDFEFDAKTLIKFVEKSTQAREYSKFIFTKTLSSILELVAEYGEYYKIEKSDMAYIDINTINNISNNHIPINHKKYLIHKINENKLLFNKSLDIITPDIIVNKESLEFIKIDERKPNFVTSKSTEGELLVLKKDIKAEELKDKIVLIEGADPGYDWIFLHGIKGLITKYGGAASHMTIRCSEFDIPAAIGCGESIYETLKESSKIKINCKSKKIIII